MTTTAKTAAVAELASQFASAGVVLTEYRGLTVAQLAELRRVLRGNATFTVVKNTLAKIAVTRAGLDQLTPMLTGPSGIVSGNITEAAKGLRDFAKANPLLVIKGGVLDGKTLTPVEVIRLADIESRDVLYARLAGAMNATRAAGVFSALPVQMARLIRALEEMKENNGEDD